MSVNIVAAEVVEKEIGPAIDSALAEAARIASSIVDQESRAVAVNLASTMKAKVEELEGNKDKFYKPARKLADDLYEVFQPRIVKGTAVVKTLLAGVNEYDRKEKRKADIAKEEATAAARKVQEEADRKRREAEAAEAAAKKAIEDEKRRKKEAEEAEERRIKAEAEEKARQERVRREAEQAEIDRKRREEEQARLDHAQAAEDAGNGEARVDNVLSHQTPISSPVASPQLTLTKDELEARQKLADDQAAEKAESERKESEAAAVRLAESKAASEKAKKEAEEAEAAAAAAAAAVAATTYVPTDDLTRKTVTWKWQIRDAENFKKLVKAVADGRAPITFLGFDANAPEKFRPAAIGKAVVKDKEEFKCDGIETWPHEETHVKAAA